MGNYGGNYEGNYGGNYEGNYSRNYNLFIIIFITMFIFLLILAYIYEYTEKFTKPKLLLKKLDPYIDPNYIPPELDFPQASQCVCAFDLDDTITCGDAKPFVDFCKKKGCKLAINTARPTNWVFDVPIEKLGFTKPWYDERDHYFNRNSYNQTAAQVGETKSNFLQLLRDKYKVPSKKCVVLFDDSVYNLSAAHERGFSTIAASERDHCGLHISKLENLNAILRDC